MIISHGALDYRVNEDGTRTLAHDYDLFYDGEVITVPGGFVTDGASIPRALWRLAGHPFATPRLFAAVAHDWLYAQGGTEAGRKRADTIFRDAQRAFGRGRFVTATEYAALRLCGKSHFNYKEESK